MDLKTAIAYVKAYRRNGRSCYVHAANRGSAMVQTNRGPVRFRSHAQSCGWGRSRTKFCAYLEWADGRAVLSRDFSTLHEISLTSSAQ